MRRSGTWKAVGGATAIVLLAAGCAVNDPGSVGFTPRTVVVGITEPQHLIPSNAIDLTSAQVLSSLFTPLVSFDDDNKPVENGAASITSPDNKVWTITLKNDATFSNGEPVVADNFIDAWNYGAYGPNKQALSSFYDRIDGYADMQSTTREPKATTLTGLRKIDDSTFTVTLSAAFPGWKYVLGHQAFLPLPKAAFSAPGVIKDGFEDAIIGNGPFRMTGEWQHNSEIVVQRAADYNGPAPKIDGVVWKIYQDSEAQYADLVVGDIDVVTSIPADRLATAPDDLGNRFRTSPNSIFTFAAFPTYQKEYAKKEVRAALSKAINRRELSDKYFLGLQRPATSFVSPVVTGFRPDTCGDTCVYDPAEAKREYTAAGGPAKVTITYVGSGNKAWVDGMCEQIVSSLGVECVGIGEAKFTDVLAKIEKREPVGMVSQGWLMAYPLMENYLGPLYGSSGAGNFFGYSSNEFDSLMKTGSTADTLNEAVRVWQQAEDVLAQDMPVLPLRFGQNAFGHSSKVTNVEVDAFAKLNLLTIDVVG
jgi:oligopeptide transport system substrate-binding protein